MSLPGLPLLRAALAGGGEGPPWQGAGWVPGPYPPIPLSPPLGGRRTLSPIPPYTLMPFPKLNRSGSAKD